MLREIIIKSENESILLDAEVIKIKAEFMQLGFRNFPSDLIAEECPFKKVKDINNWMKKSGNVWRGRNRDKKIIDSFKKALNKIKFE